MKKRELAAAVVVIAMMVALLTACGKPQTPEVKEPPVETAAQTTPVGVAEETTEPTVDVNAALTNTWSIMDNECVEEIPILPGLLLDDIKGWMKETEYKEIKLYQRTNWRTVRLGVYGDMAMAQVNMDDETLAWNIRMEKSDSRVNKTGIQVPVSACHEVIPMLDTQYEEEHYFWENNDGTCAEMYLVYFEETRNLYTFYTREDRKTYDSRRDPTVMLKTFKNEPFPEMYRYPEVTGACVGYNLKDPLYFRIKTHDGKKEYQYLLGQTIGQWVKSRYNTDGWHIEYDHGMAYAVSADNMFRISADKNVWREMSASLNKGVVAK